MSYTYAVIGAGRQGCAAGYELARWGNAKCVVLADIDLYTAQMAAARINHLLGKPIARGVKVDATNQQDLDTLLKDIDAFLSAVPYYYNLELTHAAIRNKVHMADLGGNTTIVRQQHALDREAVNAGISILPDCGQVPGLGTVLCVHAMELLDETTDVYMWDGGIPQHPRPPFDYLLTFHVAGLTNEYAEAAIFLRDGKITEVESMTELEMIEFPAPIGKLEAFVAGGGTSTMPWTFQGRLRTLQNLTLRYPGHFSQLRAFYDLGLWGLEPIDVDGSMVIPRQVFHALFEPKVVYPQDKDLVIVRVRAIGIKNQQPAEAIVQVIDYFDEVTGFTAMERTTGWSAALILELAAQSKTKLGAGGLESHVPARIFVDEFRQRGVEISESCNLIK